MMAVELLRQANQLKRSGRLDEAIALYHQVIDINPHFAFPLLRGYLIASSWLCYSP